jgi:YaiO family outer membrane protein
MRRAAAVLLCLSAWTWSAADSLDDARQQLQEGRPSSAIRALQALLRAEPQNADARCLFAQALTRQKRYIRAEKEYRAVLAQHPGHGEALSGLARVEAFRGRHESAVRLFREALDRHPQDLDTAAALGQALAWKGDFPAAEGEFQKILAQDPNHVEALAGLARVHSYQGRSVEAVALMDKALALQPDNPELLAQRDQWRDRLDSRAGSAPMVRAGAVITYEDFEGHPVGRSQELSVSYLGRAPYSFAVRGLTLERFGTTDSESEVTASRALGGGRGHAAFSAGAAARHTLLPTARFSAALSRSLGWGLAAELAALYRRYTEVTVQTVAPALVHYSRRFTTTAGYSLDSSDFRSGGPARHLPSYRLKIQWEGGRWMPWIQYARTREAFEAGLRQSREIKADHYAAGVFFQPARSWRFGLGVSRENRYSLRRSVRRMDLGITWSR